MHHPLQIRPMIASDLKDVVLLEERSFPSPWTYSVYEYELIQNRYSRYRVVVPGDPHPDLPTLLAQGGVMLLGEEAHILTIAVDPQWRQRQLGTWLLLDLIALSRAEGAHSISLEVRPSNRAAQALYFRFGFVRVGQRKRYYPDGEDAYILELNRLDQGRIWHPLARRLAQLTEEMGRGIPVDPGERTVDE